MDVSGYRIRRLQPDLDAVGIVQPAYGAIEVANGSLTWWMLLSTASRLL